MEQQNKITKEDKIAIMLRGHVRSSFDDDKLYNFLKKLSDEYNIDIYIYTFNVKSAGKIYKSEDKEANNQKITEKDVENYLRDLMKLTKAIIVDQNGSAQITNDRNIGNISRNKFLHMWNSIHNIIKHVKDTKTNYAYAINMRLDYYQLASKFPKTFSTTHMRRLFYIDVINDFVKNINKTQEFCLTNIVDNKINKNQFNNKSLNFFREKREKREKKFNVLSNINYDQDDILYGIDNLFAGKIEYLYKLSYTFVHHMDAIFDFLSEIIEDLSTFAKFYGGCGGPHEAILPLFIKNKFNYYLQNENFGE
jgi:hypothetical protein